MNFASKKEERALRYEDETLDFPLSVSTAERGPSAKCEECKALTDSVSEVDSVYVARH